MGVLREYVIRISGSSVMLKNEVSSIGSSNREDGEGLKKVLILDCICNLGIWHKRIRDLFLWVVDLWR